MSDCIINLNEVHHACLLTNDWDIYINSLEAHLSNDERGRALRFIQKSDYNNFVLSHAITRMLISKFLDIDEDEIIYDTNQHGKPFINSSTAQKCLGFNISHTNGAVLIALAANRDVGVDIENNNRDLDYLAIAEQFFSPTEINAIHTASKNNRANIFYNIWTRKESFIKAIGKGISYPLDSFSVFHQLNTSAPLSIDDEESDIMDWNIKTICYKNDFTLSFCLRSQSCNLVEIKEDYIKEITGINLDN